jgi:hypothetical protein
MLRTGKTSALWRDAPHVAPDHRSRPTVDHDPSAKRLLISMSQKISSITISHIRRIVITSHQRATAGNAVAGCINLHQCSFVTVLFDAGMSRLGSLECTVIEQFNEL